MFRSVRQSQTVNRSLTVVLTLVCLLTVALLSKGALPKLHSAANAQTDPSPLVLINLPGMAFPDSALLGEKFCYTARIVNTSSSNIPGYGPYLRLFLPPGLTLEDATLPGVSTTSVSTPTPPSITLDFIGARPPLSHVRWHSTRLVTRGARNMRPHRVQTTPSGHSHSEPRSPLS